MSIAKSIETLGDEYSYFEPKRICYFEKTGQGLDEIMTEAIDFDQVKIEASRRSGIATPKSCDALDSVENRVNLIEFTRFSERTLEELDFISKEIDYMSKKVNDSLRILEMFGLSEELKTCKKQFFPCIGIYLPLNDPVTKEKLELSRDLFFSEIIVRRVSTNFVIISIKMESFDNDYPKYR